MKLTLGLYGLYLLLVAIKGNAGQLATDFQADAKGFFPWLIVAAVLGGLYEFGPTHAFAASFLLLVVLTFVLINFNNLKSQFSTIYNNSTAAASTVVSAVTPTAPATSTGTTQ